jgi:Right handed beta helix region
MHRSSFCKLLVLIPFLPLMNGCVMPVFNCFIPPSITGQPSGQSIAVGQAAIFTVAAAGTAPLSFQWLKNGVAISGATQASYITPPALSTDSGSTFTVTVSNKYGARTSSIASLTVASQPATNVSFVAPNGNDSNPGTIDQPFLTIQHCATAVSPGWTCLVRAGTYRETVSPNSGITISAYNFEQVTVDGSDPVTGWTLYQGSIYEAPVAMNSGDTNQVFVGRNMMTEARWPNGNDLFHVNWATAQAGTTQGQIVDPNLPPLNWTGAKIHLWSGSDPFGHETGVVMGSGTGQISISVDETGTCPTICPATGGYYYLFGTLSALDAEQEWFYDSNSGILYFMAPGRVNPNTLDVRAKQRPYAFDLRGKSGVTIQNIAIFASTIILDNGSTNDTLNRINAQYVSHFTTLPVASNDPGGNNFSILQVHVDDSGIVINGTGNTLENSMISYSAGAGVALEGANNKIVNNLIENIDYIGDYASGVDLDGNGNIVQNNTINGIGRQGILVNAVINQEISYNNLFNAMMLSRDGGEIYACCLQAASGTGIDHNWIHDTTAVITGAGDSNPLSGVNIDNNSSGFNVDQNVIWNNHPENIFINGQGLDGPNNNYIYDNTIPDSSSQGTIDIHAVTDCTSVRVINNRAVVRVDEAQQTKGCILSNNNSSAPGASEMAPTTQVGCNFSGCSSSPPPAIIGGGVTSCPVVGDTSP